MPKPDLKNRSYNLNEQRHEKRNEQENREKGKTGVVNEVVHGACHVDGYAPRALVFLFIPVFY